MSHEQMLSEHDRQLLEAVDETLAGEEIGKHTDASLRGTCAFLAQAGAEPGDAFRQDLEARLLVAWEQAAGQGERTARARPLSIRTFLTFLFAPHGQFSPARSVLVALIALALLAGLAATARAVYIKMVVVEPSFDVAGLAEAMRPAQFPVLTPGQGQLIRVYTLGRPDGSAWEYSIVLDYRLQDERRFTIVESKARPGLDLQRHYRDWQQQEPDRVRVLDWDVDVNGFHGVLYQVQGELVATPPPGWRPWGTFLTWQTDGTELVLNEDMAYPAISPDEMIAIARSMQEAKR